MRELLFFFKFIEYLGCRGNLNGKSLVWCYLIIRQVELKLKRKTHKHIINTIMFFLTPCGYKVISETEN